MAHGKRNAVTSASTLPTPLTNREQEVLELIAFGLSNKEIAERLSLSRRTVESHIDHLLGKLNAPTRARAVVEAGRAGLLGGQTLSETAYTAERRPNNLPFQLTTLWGRENDLVEAKTLVADHRLVTLSGSGGVGKTRLALRLGAEQLDLNPHGVWLCDFSPIADPMHVPSTVGKVLAVRERQNRPLVDSIVDALKHKQALLIFDNCEHVLHAAAELADEVLHRCADIRILATSRQPLAIMGEVVYRVRSLSLPDRADGMTATQSLDYGAIALFVDRAQASDADFAFIDASVPIVAEICDRLDGIPLAIELAATRSNAISLQSLARSLDDRFKVLTAGGRTALPRHRTLGALIDWSYDLLARNEQTLFKRLGVFAGGFSLDAMRAVCGGDDFENGEIVELLVSLTDKSLVIADMAGKHERYRLLESTRAYALEKLAADGERDGMARRHAEYFRDEARAAHKRWGHGSVAAWLSDVEAEIDNYRTALEWALTDQHDAALGGTIAGCLIRLWFDGGLAAEGRYWIDRAQALVDETAYPGVAARLWLGRGVLSDGKSKHDCAERSIPLYRSAGDERGELGALLVLGYSCFQMGRLEQASVATSTALAMARQLGDAVKVASSLNQLGIIQCDLGDVAAGRRSFTEALATFKALDNESGFAQVVSCLAELEFACGQFEEALRLASEALETHSRGKNAADTAIDYINIAAYSIPLGDVDGARKAAREALRWSRQGQRTVSTAIALQHFASVGALSGQARDAARLLGFVNARYAALALEREFTERWSYDNLLAVLQAQLSDAERAELENEGAVWPEDRAIAEAFKI